MLEDDSVVRSVLRGKFKKEFALKKDKQFVLDVAAVGDYVTVEMQEDGTGRIVKVHDRENYLSRKAPKMKGAAHRGERLEQIVAANVDLLVIVMSCKNPEFNNKLLDRIIVTAESSSIDVLILFNKIDLDDGAIDKWQNLYGDIGYKTVPTSVVDSKGLDLVMSELKDKTSLFWGPSGVGKSSILNKLFPELNLKVKKVSSATTKGRHTTVTSILEKVEPNTFVVDTPGMREIDPYGIMKEDLGHYFVEFNPAHYECKFNTCTHHHEPGCAVVEAVEKGGISVERYESYLNLLETIEEDLFFN